MIKQKVLAMAIASAMTIGCGGGGGQAGSPAPQQVCRDPNALNFNQTGQCVFGPLPNSDVMVFRTGRQRVHDMGFRGQGIIIGLSDGPITRGNCMAGESPADCLVRRARERGWEVPVGQVLEIHYMDVDAQANHGEAMLRAILGRYLNDDVSPPMTPIAPEARVIWRPLGRQEFPYLLSRGARIINASWGDDIRFASDYTEAQYQRIRSVVFEPLRQHDAVLIQAQAYTRRSEAHGGEIVRFQEANGLALLRPDFEQYRGHYILVVAVTFGADGNVTNLYRGAVESSSPCGEARMWCVAAPGRLGNILGGTSVASAQASGYAAVLWSAFPWFSAPNLTVTLLTTARDIGAPGVDDEYGWGLIDIATAVNGPRQFIYRDFVANVNREGTWTFRNNITGEYGLTVRGIGALRLAGQNTYRGITLIDGGHLILSGSVSGDVRNGGRLTSEGGRIGGVYFALPGSTTAVHVGSPLQVTGLAAVQGTMLILAPLQAAYSVQNRETLIRAGQVQGRFDRTQVGSGFFYTATLDYTPSEVAALLTRTASAQAEVRSAGGNRRQIEGAGWIERALDQLPNLSAEVQSRVFGIAMEPTDALARLGSVSAHVQAGARAMLAHEAAERTRLAADRLRHGDGFVAYAEAHDALAGDLRHDGFGGSVGWSGEGYGVLLSAGRGDGSDLFGSYDARRTGLTGMVNWHGLEATLSLDRIRVDTTRFADGDRLRSERTDYVLSGRVEYAEDAWYLAAGAVSHRIGRFSEDGPLGVAGKADRKTTAFVEGGFRERFGAEEDRWGALDVDVSLRRNFRRTMDVEGVFAGGVPVRAEGEPLPKHRLRVSASWNKAIDRDLVVFVGAHGASDGRDVLDRRVDVGLRVKW